MRSAWAARVACCSVSSVSMIEEFRLAEQVTDAATGLGIELALIGANALAFHNYVRGTSDVDFATHASQAELGALRDVLELAGLKVHAPDDEDPLGGMLVVWEEEDEDGAPVEPVEVVNFDNPYRDRTNPGREAVRTAEPIAGSSMRCVRLPFLVALKLFAGALDDRADVVALLRANPMADREEIRAVCEQYGLSAIDELIQIAAQPR